MSTGPTTTEQAPPAWGDPQPPAPKWSGKKTLVAAAVAIAIAAVGGVAIYLGTSANSTSSQQGGFGGPGGGGARMNILGRRGMETLAQALHGDFTVQENGSYVTERMQRGEVTALSSASITVKSTDGYTQTYTIDSSTEKASNLATGSSAMVLAKLNGTAATATSVTDANQTLGGGMNSGPGFPGQGFPGQQQPPGN